MHNIYVNGSLTLIILATRIANIGSAAPLHKDAIQPIRIVNHSGLFINKSLRKMDCRFNDAELF